MREFAIVTDSCCDLTQDLRDEWGLTVVPLSVLLGEDSFLDAPGHGPDPHSFYQRVAAGETVKTSAPNVEVFKDALRPLLESGKDILYLAFASVLSATCQNGTIAMEELSEDFPEAKLLVVDTLCENLGQALLIDLCVEQKRQGRTIEEVRDFAEEKKLTICHWFTVGDLNHLRRGGRLSAGKAILGSILHVKPILHTDDTGRLVAMGSVRGRKKALTALVDKMQELALPIPQKVYITHSDCLEDAEFVASLVRERFEVESLTIRFIGPVIGAHTGQDTIGLFFQGKNR